MKKNYMNSIKIILKYPTNGEKKLKISSNISQSNITHTHSMKITRKILKHILNCVMFMLISHSILNKFLNRNSSFSFHSIYQRDLYSFHLWWLTCHLETENILSIIRSLLLSNSYFVFLKRPICCVLLFTVW